MQRLQSLHVKLVERVANQKIHSAVSPLFIFWI